MENEIFIPVMRYFTNGNAFSGSFGALRFLLTPSGESINVKVWHGKLSLEKSTVEEEASFDLSDTGREEIRKFLTERI